MLSTHSFQCKNKGSNYTAFFHLSFHVSMLNLPTLSSKIINVQGQATTILVHNLLCQDLAYCVLVITLLLFLQQISNFNTS